MLKQVVMCNEAVFIKCVMGYCAPVLLKVRKYLFTQEETDSGGMLFAFLTFNPANKEQEGMGLVDLLPF